MNGRYSFSKVAIALVLSFLFLQGLGITAGEWILTDKDYKVWDAYPQLKGTATWSGSADEERYASGKGVLQWFENGRPVKFEGIMIKGRLTGKGSATIADFARYEGDFADGTMNGKGTMTLSNGSRYEGDWVGGKMTGYGILILNGNRYEGDFINDNFNGKGTLTLPNGNYYEGDWVDGKMTGYGTVYSPNGSVIRQGQWENNIFVGSK